MYTKHITIETLDNTPVSGGGVFGQRISIININPKRCSDLIITH